MYDPMEPLVQFSPFAGRLKELTVPGETSKEVEHENDVYAADGAARTMLCYAPRSGCPDAKQTQVMFVLRQDASTESAQELMERLELDRLAEKEHFLLLFPNPTQLGWNYLEESDRDNDMDYLIRCFGLLRGSELKVNGFNGMLFYIAACPEASAMLAAMAARRPASVSAMLTVDLPRGYQLPKDARNVEVAAWCCPGPVAEYLHSANGCRDAEYPDGAVRPGRNPECRLVVSSRPLDAATLRDAWAQLFSPSRRWQNDTYGTYQHRTAFTQRGFTAHVGESCMGVNDNFPHTWFEYIPPRLRGSADKVPVVFYFHGVNCVPLYGAEQSNWHDIADRENFIVIYPAPAKAKCWNIYDLPNMVSDFAFVLALINHIKQVHPIDERRIYITGFSMGAMMTHALAAAYPEIFAAGAPCNAFAFNRYKDPEEALKFFLRGVDVGNISYSAQMADRKRREHPEYRMPIFQNAGMVDRDIGVWPVNGELDDVRGKTIRFWKEFNHISMKQELDDTTLTGLAADETVWMDKNQRFLRQTWYSQDTKLPMLELVVAKRMPHAIDPVQIEWAWDYIRRFARGEDGKLIVLD
ncbi:MAG: alpha/beta hydrolase family esterase [Faecousia sp.]